MPRIPHTVVAILIVSAPAAGAQTSLRDALRLADRAAFANRAAAGATAAERGTALAPLRGVLPSLRLETGYVRTTDPIGAFGSTLRQRTITAADFDPSRLNYPAAVGNYQANVALEQPLFNADAWLGRRAALDAEHAAAAQEDWTRVATHTDVIRAYYGAVLAVERARTLDIAADAAHAHVRQAESMQQNGLVTRSDVLLADVRAGDLDAQLAEARGTATSAVRQLEVALGQDPTGAVALPAALPPADRIRGVAAPDTADAPLAARADVDAARRGLDAAHADVLRARSAYVPRLNAFVRYDWNSAARLYAGDKNWTAGVMASWSPFAGASEIADARAAAGRESSARAQADAATARARLEVEQTRTALVVALTRLGIAERAVVQSAEAHRIVTRKYDGGLATIAELLDAQAAETQSALALAQARYGTIVAAAERRQALGRDPASLATLEDSPAVVARPSHDATPPER